MKVESASSAVLVVFASLALGTGTEAMAQGKSRDQIGDLIGRAPPAGAKQGPTQKGAAEPAGDPRADDPAFIESQRLMKAVDAILQDAARQRGEAAKLPSAKDFLLKPLWTETREDRQRKVRELLDAVLGVVTDVPVVDVQKRIDGFKRNIRELDRSIIGLKERQLVAPKDGFLPGIVSDTVESVGKQIDDAKARIGRNREEIAKAKTEVLAALQKGGIQLGSEQVDLLLDGVLSGDLVRLVAVFTSAKAIDQQLAKLLAGSGESIAAARKYFGMHAALFAMLVHAQTGLIEKIDRNYLPKLEAITKDIATARAKTKRLLEAENRPDQRRTLEANRESQRLAEAAAKGYRRYLMQQREQIARARSRAAHDLRIADNTFETVEASFQLRNLMRDSDASFEALQRLEAPTFEQIFKNEELRREFESLTKRLEVPSS